MQKNAGDGYLESEEPHPGFSWDGYRMSIGHFDGTNYDSLSWNAWQPYNYDYLVTTENLNLVEHRYKRNTYSVYYMNNGTLVNTVSHLYEQPFNAETEGASPLLLPPGPGYTFAGWYDNAETLGTPLTQMTMPAANIRLYAK
ncbi:MAG: InlB B-repeat-containing protein [Lancefieldella sp.]